MKDISMQILVGGKVLAEQNGIVKVPWNSEYVVRLKNRHRLPAAVALFVDNQAVKDDGGMLVLFGNSTIDVPGFAGANGHNKAFKFVRAGDARVAQPNEPENGVIMARAYLQELVKTNPLTKETIIIDRSWPVYYPQPIWIWYPHTQPWFQPYCWPSPVWCSAGGGGTTTSASLSMNSNSNSNSNSPMAHSTMSGPVNATVNVGATVPGSDVYQKLNDEVKFDMQQQPQELILKLQGCAKLFTRKIKRSPSRRAAKRR